MDEKIHLLITERNPNVREFLKREMEAEGYSVISAVNGREMLRQVYSGKPLDLIILDPDMKDVDVAETLRMLSDRVPEVTIVLHTFLRDYEEYGEIINDAVFVEKQGNSIEDLKQVIINKVKTIVPLGKRLKDNTK